MTNTLPTPQQTTLEYIAAEGIISAASWRIDGGGYNNVLLRTEDHSYLVSPWDVQILEHTTDTSVVVLATVPTVVNATDMAFFDRVESSIHNEEVSHRQLPITVPRMRVEQLTTTSKHKAAMQDRIMAKLSRQLRHPRKPVTHVFGTGTVHSNGTFTIMVNEFVDGITYEYEYSYNLETGALTKEDLLA